MQDPSENIEMTPPIQIALLTDDGLDELEKAIPRHGSHQTRLQAQREGRSRYLIAYQNATPVGHLNLRWDGISAPEVTKYIHDCPEINGLPV